MPTVFVFYIVTKSCSLNKADTPVQKTNATMFWLLLKLFLREEKITKTFIMKPPGFQIMAPFNSQHLICAHACRFVTSPRKFHRHFTLSRIEIKLYCLFPEQVTHQQHKKTTSCFGCFFKEFSKRRNFLKDLFTEPPGFLNTL